VLAELEVVWPLHRSHYLNPSLQESETDMIDHVTSDPTPVSAPGRDLAARALLAAACTQQRVSTLLETSRRSVGRDVDNDLRSIRQDAGVVAEARAVLAESARRGSTVEEREAAERWLAQARPTHQAVETTTRRPPPRRSMPRGPKAASTPAGRSPNGRSPTTPRLPIEALERQRQRILHRTQLIEYVLTAEQRNGGMLTLGDALAELLQDITDAARAIGALVQPLAPSRRA
jgi:hypothetical protein